MPAGSRSTFGRDLARPLRKGCDHGGVLVINKQADKILANTFWASGGWRADPDWPTPDDRETAESAGYLFPSIELDHDTIVGEVRRLAGEASLEVAAESFVASLSTRWKFLRSFLPSVAVGRQLPDHAFTADREPHEYRCAVCGLEQGPVEVDRNVFSFERHGWGGVRHLHLDNVWFVLDCFAREGGAVPSDADAELLSGSLAAIQALDPKASASKAETALKVIPSSKDERFALLEILAVVDVLLDPEHPGFLDEFVPMADRSLPPKHFADRGYPAEWWTAGLGVNADAVERLFLQLRP